MLKQLREEKGLTQVELAAAAGVSPTTIGEYERKREGRRPMRKSTAKAIAGVLGCEVWEVTE